MKRKQADKTVQPLRVALIGLDEQLSVFSVVLTSTFGKFVLVKDELADVAIVNMDAYGAPAHRQAYGNRFPCVPLILLGTEPQADAPGSLWVRRPIKMEDLLSAIHKSIERSPGNRQPQLVETAPKTVADRVAALTESGKPQTRTPACRIEAAQLFYDPGQYLQGIITQVARTAATQDTAYVVKSVASDSNQIHVLPSGRVGTRLSDAKLRFHSVVAISDWTDKVSAVADIAKLPSDARSIPFDDFIWKITIWTARGRLAAGTNIDTPFRLAYWPNLTRLLPIAHGLRIAAYWIKNEASIREVAAELGLPFPAVCDFFSATSAIGAMEAIAGAHAQRSAETPAALNHPAVEAPPRGMLSRLMGKLLNLAA
jgi:hypothetical protein